MPEEYKCEYEKMDYYYYYLFYRSSIRLYRMQKPVRAYIRNMRYKLALSKQPSQRTRTKFQLNFNDTPMIGANVCPPLLLVLPTLTCIPLMVFRITLIWHCAADTERDTFLLFIAHIK